MTKLTLRNCKRLIGLATVAALILTPGVSALAATSALPARIAPAASVAPTAITLLSFSAQRLSDTSAEVRWQTALERQVFGFALYRSSTSLRADAIRINPNLIPAQGQNGAGASYRFVDVPIQPGVTYFYWLQELGTDGSLSEFGPVSTASAYVFVPLVVR